MDLVDALAVLSAVCTGLIGGVFFAFSSFVMRALGQLPPAQGVAIMQRINLTVLNPVFLGVFLGTVPLLAATAFVARQAGRGTFSALLVSFVVYSLGSVGVTLACNVPRNARLAPLDPGSAAAAAFWPVYQREWLAWNHLRCLASPLAAAAAAFAVDG